MGNNYIGNVYISHNYMDLQDGAVVADVGQHQRENRVQEESAAAITNMPYLLRRDYCAIPNTQ